MSFKEVVSTVEIPTDEAVQKQRHSTHDTVMNVMKTGSNFVGSVAEIGAFGAGASVKAVVKLTKGFINGLSV